MEMAPQHYENMDLLKELEENNAFFDDLVDMIPAKLYVAGNSGDEQYNPKYYKGQHKESKEARRARNKKAKRAKFDPDLAETTLQVKQRLEQEEESAVTCTLSQPSTPSHDMTTKMTPSPANMSQNNENDNDNNTPTTPEPTSLSTTHPSSSKESNASRIEALRAKLHARLAEKRGQRPTDPSVVSKRAARRAEKQRRQEEARRKRAASSAGKSAVDASSSSTTTPQYTINKKKVPPNADLIQDLSQMDFGKLAGLQETPKNFINNKSLANLSKKKNLKKMLADAEEKRKRLEELRRGDSEEKTKAQHILWSDTLREAGGERVKDDPAKLRKAIKRKEAKKKKSVKAWKSRMEQTREKMDKRQQIRSHNLEKRKMGGSVGANLSKKRIVDGDSEDHGAQEGGKRRQSRAGFEGRKQEFLNQRQGDKGTKDQQ